MIVRRWELHPPIDLKSKNRSELNRGGRARFGMYARERDGYARTLRTVALQARVAPLALFAPGHVIASPPAAAPVPFRRVTVVRLMGTRQRAFDDDGFIGGAAAFRDACQRERYHRGRYVPGAGLVWDDSATWSEWHYEQRKSDDGRPGVLVVVEDVAR